MKKRLLHIKFIKDAVLPILCVCLVANTVQAKESGGVINAKSPGIEGSITVSSPKIETIKITGVVTDDKNLPLPGVVVTIKGTNIGAATDGNGKYTINADENAVLVFKLLGYISKEVNVDKHTKIDVQLASDQKNLNEVVVIGYGTQKKRDVTGAVGSVSLTDVAKTPVFGTAQLLEGQVSGVQVTQTNSQPGAAFTVRVRGTNSINYSSDPLYVVDGFAGADITGLNPDDIASIDVLKDASSTAIYGNRGANGVIIITTKSGTSGKSTVTADVYDGVQNVSRMLPMMDAQQFATYLNRVTTYNNQNNTTQTALPYTQAQIDGMGKGTNWQEALFQRAPIVNANAAISGGSPGTKYFVSMGFFNQDGIILNSGYERGNLRFNLTHNISKKLTFGLNSQLSYDQQEIANVNTNGGSTGGTLLDALRISPIVPIRDNTGAYTFQNEPNGYVDLVGNPVAAAELNTDVSKNLRVFANSYLTYEIIPDLKLKVSLGTSDIFNREDIFRPSTTFLGLTTNGFAQISNPINFNWLNENTLTYTKQIDKNQTITALAGYTFQQFKYTTSSASAQNLTTNNLGTDNLGVGGSLSSSSSTNSHALESFLGRVNYSLMDRYLLTLSIRRDGASVLGSAHNFGTFPSGALAWRVSNEDFMKNVSTISDLKLRVGYGVTGNSNIDPYSSLSQYGFNSYVLNNTRVVGTSANNIGNDNLQWEQTASTNIGVDLGLLQNRITFNADVYDKKTTKLLFNRSIPASSGFTTLLDNLGAVSNKGIELSLTTIDVASKDIRWTTNFNFSRNVNKILSLGGIPYQITGNVSSSLYPGGQNSSILQVGQPIGAFYGYKFEGIWQSQAQITASGTKEAVKPGDPRYADLNGDNNITAADRTIIGYAVPKFNYGFTSNLTVQRFNLFVLIQGVYGNQILNENLIESENGTTTDNKQAYVLTQSWNGPGTSNTLPSVGSTLRRSLGPTSDVLESGSYLRFKTITLSYDLPLPKLTPVFKSASVYITGQNLITITKYKGYDPEVNSYPDSSGNYTSLGTDYNPYPNVRTFLLGAKFGF
ncbi:TonB-linked SusC/RagA family outer membrane protein [Mucilaginibacter frigoritolerans]|uniref:TonB-linked SusC/RagA family outer membrane protein n=1 Tax=Mucilaginibacter frigoritolerans TaxID=652788 RepID=A0A562TPR3_9SPHI|nr:TonB-dependent receptor [Mucilaginibacter frigoritolerans]TWI95559.1 TonB-linked SusC/RagA family outer membrane protein [Mucilaginibacter frigoritolerans]